MKRHNNARLLFPAISSAVTAVILLIAFRWLTGPLQYALLMGAGISAVAFVPAAVAVRFMVCAVSIKYLLRLCCTGESVST
jgi:hypothetical protein